MPREGSGKDRWGVCLQKSKLESKLEKVRYAQAFYPEYLLRQLSFMWSNVACCPSLLLASRLKPSRLISTLGKGAEARAS